MNNELLTTFIILNIVNVIIQTVKSLVTVKCKKFVAAVINAVAYGLYTVVTIYMLCDLPLLWKALIVAGCNFIGVFFVKWIEEVAQKDKLWKVEATLPGTWSNPKFDRCVIDLEESGIPFNYIDANKYLLINCYCATQADSAKVKRILNNHNAKYFVSESKVL